MYIGGEFSNKKKFDKIIEEKFPQLREMCCPLVGNQMDVKCNNSHMLSVMYKAGQVCNSMGAMLVVLSVLLY